MSPGPVPGAGFYALVEAWSELQVAPSSRHFRIDQDGHRYGIRRGADSRVITMRCVVCHVHVGSIDVAYCGEVVAVGVLRDLAEEHAFPPIRWRARDHLTDAERFAETFGGVVRASIDRIVARYSIERTMGTTRPPRGGAIASCGCWSAAVPAGTSYGEPMECPRHGRRWLALPNVDDPFPWNPGDWRLPANGELASSIALDRSLTFDEARDRIGMAF